MADTNTLLLFESDSRTMLSEDLKVRVINALEVNGRCVETVGLKKDEVFQCLGCLLCLTKHPGECVNNDIVNRIRKNVSKYTATIFITPIVFGQYSSTMAGAINRGTGCHNWQVFIGYGEDIDDEEKSTFIDLTARHRGKADIVHPGMDRQVDVFASRSIEDNIAISEALMRMA